MMTAGEFTDLVSIESKTTTRDSYGSAIETWAESATAWVKPYQSRGEQAVQAGRENATRVVRFKMMWRSIDTTQRIVWRNETYEIHEVDETERLKGIVWVTARAQV